MGRTTRREPIRTGAEVVPRERCDAHERRDEGNGVRSPPEWRSRTLVSGSGRGRRPHEPDDRPAADGRESEVRDGTVEEEHDHTQIVGRGTDIALTFTGVFGR